uniref:Glycosyltransferase N-terminal domain-containing protein n=1 Tax=Leersia perrieri TaxID=77586 RepID=A0A0D9X5P7_9ORYZ
MATHTRAGVQPHVLVVPFPAQGHMLALLDLAALLATRGDLTVTVAVTAGNASLLEPLLATCPTIGVATLPFPRPSPLLPPGCETEHTKDLSWHDFWMFVPTLAALRGPLLGWCEAQAQQSTRVTAVVSDLFTGWTRLVADEIGATHVTFSPCSALFLAIAPMTWPTEEEEEGHVSKEVEEAEQLFPVVAGDPVPGDEAYDEICQIILWSLENDVIVVNSFAAFEGEGAYLELKGSGSTSRRVFAVGPLSEAWPTRRDRGGKSVVSPAEVAAWLDGFSDGEVVYVSFGTQHALSTEQTARVADALTWSAAAFVWVIAAEATVPEGFEAATAGRGLVIHGWAPQVDILHHRAVGWFLMHCGMNAVLEAVSAGVAMLTWPMGADHYVNRRLLQEAGVAVHLAEGKDAVPDAGEMAKAIAVAVGNEGKPTRDRAARLGCRAAAAVAPGGNTGSTSTP